jgi:hypothetical protein
MFDTIISGMWEIVQKENIKFLKYPDKDIPAMKDYYTMQRLRNLRIALEPMVFNQLNETYGKKLNDFWETYTPPLRSSKTFVVIERRCHPNMWFVLRNILWSGSSLGMSIVIYCSDENEGYIRGLLADKVDSFHIIPFFKGEGDAKNGIIDYNDLLTRYTTYEQILDLTGASYMITVQMDNYFRRKMINELFIHEYYGAPWAWDHTAPGGSGVTFRRIQLMIDICKKYRPALQILIEETGEDCWWNNVLRLEKAHIPLFSFRWRIINESSHLCIIEDEKQLSFYNPFIIHQSWTYIDMNWTFDLYINYWRALLEIKI